MARYGMNVRPDDEHDPAELRRRIPRFEIPRIVCYPEVDLRPWLERAAQVEMQPLLVFPRESFPGWEPGWQQRDYQPTLEGYSEAYRGLVYAVSFGNEASIKSPSSWTMPPGAANEGTRAVAAAFPECVQVSTADASGVPWWASANAHGLEELRVRDEWNDYAEDDPRWEEPYDFGAVDAIAVHAYGIKPDRQWEGPYDDRGLPDLSWWLRQGKPVWVTEYGAPDFDFVGQAALRGEWYRRATRALRRAGASVLIAMSYQGEVPPFDVVGTAAEGPYRAATEEGEEARMGKIEEMEAAGTLLAGARWRPEELPVEEIPTTGGDTLRLAWCTDGLAIEAPTGEVWTPVEATPESFLRVFAQAIAAQPEAFKAAVEAAGFRIVPV